MCADVYLIVDPVFPPSAADVCTANGVFGSSCTCSALAGRCNDLSSWGSFVSSSSAEMQALVVKTGGYCSVTCARCTENTPTCLDAPMPTSLSGTLEFASQPQVAIRCSTPWVYPLPVWPH